MKSLLVISSRVPEYYEHNVSSIFVNRNCLFCSPKKLKNNRYIITCADDERPPAEFRTCAIRSYYSRRDVRVRTNTGRTSARANTVRRKEFVMRNVHCNDDDPSLNRKNRRRFSFFKYKRFRVYGQ